MIFENAKWIWIDSSSDINEYAEFHEKFDYNGEKAILRLCADSEYIVHLNGRRILFCQFANYRTEKYYDEDDISQFCKSGENELCITVRYEGIDTACHVPCGAGVIYSLSLDEKQKVFSSASTLCRKSPYYLSGESTSITPQLGLGSTAIADTLAEKAELFSATEIERTRSFEKRPVERLVELPKIYAKELQECEKRIYDLGREEVGYLFVKVKCKAPTTLTVAYGEHLDDKEVRYAVGGRNFALDFVCDKGENYFEQFFIRIAGRYLQIITPDDAEMIELGVIPVIYPLTEIPHHLDGLDAKIYDVSMRTLRLCMHTHYEDCPWREQALYVMDSRNQMLCGYYAFKETAFQRANLVFISKGRRDDGMLELTYPAENTPAIPFFSAMYPVAVCEYMEHTGDYSIAKEVMPTMLSILDRLNSFKQDGIIVNPPLPYWNFYEWSEGNSGALFADDGGRRELILNCAFVYSVERLKKICALADLPCPDYKTEEMKSIINEVFFNKESGIFYPRHDGGKPSALGNAFALLIGLGDERTVDALKNDKTLVPATLSMLAFVYDALLVDVANTEFVLADIRKNYSYMLDHGATSFWETIKGASDFGNSGSLCHGWSAIPIYYFNKLLK